MAPTSSSSKSIINKKDDSVSVTSTVVANGAATIITNATTKESNSNNNTSSSSSSTVTSSFHYEFGGPIGTFMNIILLPIIVVLLSHWSHIGYISLDVATLMMMDTPEATASSTTSNVPFFYFSSIPHFNNQYTNYIIQRIVPCICIVLFWLVYQILLERCVPAIIVSGTPIPIPTTSTTDTTSSGIPKEMTSTTKTPTSSKSSTFQLQYRINGHLIFWMTLCIFVFGWPTFIDTTTTTAIKTTNVEIQQPGFVLQFGTFPYWSFLYNHFTELAIATSILCYIGASYLYLYSYRPATPTTPVILAAGGNSGNLFYDYFMGRELNPRPPKFINDWFFQNTFDYKEFCELRPGLMGWMILNIACIYEQYNVLGYNTGSMILINIFQGIYIWDALYCEASILSTMDITTDGFGFMLLFGDLCWVPFTYSIQARYLVHHDPHLSIYQLGGIILIHIFGYIVFRSANGQKDTFRRNPNDPSVAHLSYITTKRGTKLLTSGWWGMARKINYTGDYIMGLSWCMVCGYNSIVPYFYAIYFLILLIHRSERDDHMCYQKYGTDWIEYKKIVPYRFIPGIV